MGQTVFITGAGQGLGLAMAEKYLELGFMVFAGYFRHESRLDDLQTIYPELQKVHCDVTDVKSIAAAVREVGHQVKGLDMLINNAGIHTDAAFQPLENLDFVEICATFDVNTFGPLQVTKNFLKLMENGAAKLIVNISSEAGSIGDCKRRNEFGYCMSKAALNMQSQILQNYLGPKGFKILAVHPGWMRTAMGGAEADIDPREAAEGIVELTRRKWEPQDGIYFDYTGKPMPW